MEGKPSTSSQTNGHRRPVKERTLSRRETTLQRMRDECTERFAQDREALRERLRLDTSSVEEAIRCKLNSMRLTSPDNESINKEDIDRLVDDFVNELLHGSNEVLEENGDFFAEEEIDDAFGSAQEGWVRCPLCVAGWVVIPFPGILTCDACNGLQLRLPSESYSVQDFATALDSAIRNHANSPCQQSFKFIMNEGNLGIECVGCGTTPVFI